MKRFMLPAGLVCAFLLAMILPEPGIWLSSHRAALGIAALMFFINGYQTDIRNFCIGKRFVTGIVIGASVSFIGGAALGKAASVLLHFPHEIAAGLIIMCVMAPTLTTVIVITKESGGNALWALLMTVTLNLLSILFIPPILTIVLKGGAPIPALHLFIDLAVSVLLPFIAGSALRVLVKRDVPGMSLVPTALIVALSYLSFSSGRATILTAGAASLIIAATALSIHLILFSAAAILARAVRFSDADMKAVAFIGSQKTLPAAMAIIASIGLGGGAAAVPCVLFHFSQIMADSIIAFVWGTRRAVGVLPGRHVLDAGTTPRS